MSKHVDHGEGIYLQRDSVLLGCMPNNIAVRSLMATQVESFAYCNVQIIYICTGAVSRSICEEEHHQ